MTCDTTGRAGEGKGCQWGAEASQVPGWVSQGGGCWPQLGVWVGWGGAGDHTEHQGLTPQSSPRGPGEDGPYQLLL